MPTTGLRFFTVYGPWSRPDMSLYNFVDNIVKNKPINVFNYGNHIRDFTYVDDIVSGIISAIKTVPKYQKNKINPSPDTSSAPYEIYNIGTKPVKLMKYIKLIEKFKKGKSKMSTTSSWRYKIN